MDVLLEKLPTLRLPESPSRATSIFDTGLPLAGPVQNWLLSERMAHASAASKILRESCNMYQAHVHRRAFEIRRTGGFTFIRRFNSLISRMSHFNTCLSDGYKIHHTSVSGRCFAADAMNAAAPTGKVRKYISLH